MNSLLNGVLRLREAGLSTIPIKADGSKAPALPSWKPYQERLPDEGELRQWFGNGARPGVALVGGKVSGNLEVMDFDAPELIAEWRELVESAAPGLLEQLPQVETPSGGLHVLYRCAEIGGNTKLAQNAAGHTLVETRAEGGYVVTAGSPAACHSSGKLYRLVNGDLKTIPEITPGERDILLDCARSFNERVKPEPDPAPTNGASSGLRPGDDYNQRGDSRGDLERHGWRYLRLGPRGELWARPGVNHTSATRFPDGSLYVFSVNAAPFDSERVYAPFSIRAWLDHNGDFVAAAKALAAEGYGDKRQAKREKSKAQAEPTTNEPAQEAAPIRAGIEHEQVLAKILAALKPVSFRDEAELEPDQKLNQKHYCVVATQKIVEMARTLQCGLCKHLDFIYAFNGQYWRQIEKDEMTKFLGEAAEKLGVEKITARWFQFRDALLKQFLAAAYLPRPERKNGVTLINLKNGTFEISATQRLREYKREDFLTYQLPFDYGESADCPQWRKFLDEVLPDELGREKHDTTEGAEPFKARQQICAEFVGYCFTTNLKLEKVLLPYGSGANGKSVFFDVITALFDAENISHFGLHHLTHEYNRAKIANKLLNYGMCQ